MRVVLCDLTHTGQGYGSEFIPYAIGCLNEYAGGGAILCKTVDELKEACKTKPDVVGFSHYLWNTRLSNECARQIEERWHDVQIIFGGPSLTLDKDRRIQWLRERPWISAYVTEEGEAGWELALATIEGGGRFESAIIKSPPLVDVNSIPSPYLSGALDRYLANPKLVPLTEATRGCPFTCTFCVQGAQELPIRHYSLARLKDEIRYVAQRTKIKSLYLSDANFGMYQSDESFADFLAETKKDYGYPEYIVVSTAKSNKERVIRIASKLGFSLPVASSVQSLDPYVLKAVRRTNIPTQELAAFPLALDQQSVSYSEIISSLPADTKEKHVDGVCQLVDMGYDQIRMHQLTLLPGSEMEKDRHQFVTRHRLLQRFFGDYDLFKPVKLYETEEIVYAHDTMSPDDFMYCRAFGLTVSLMFNEGMGKELAHYMASRGLRYSEFLRFAHDAMMQSTAKDPIANAYRSFICDARAELYDNLRDLSLEMEDGGWDELMRGERANNLLRNTQGLIIYEHHEALTQMMFYLARGFLYSKSVHLVDGDGHCFDEFEDYCRYRKGPVSNLEREDVRYYHYDFTTFERVPGYALRFYYEPWQKELFSNLIGLFGTTPQGLGKLIARSPIKHTYRHTETVQLQQLAIVIGPARSGTSLAADLVHACGWPLSKRVRRPTDLRDYRNEESDLHPLEPTDCMVADKLAQWTAEGTKAIKMVVNWEWIDALAKRVPDIRLIVCTRDPDEIAASRAEGIISAPPDVQVISNRLEQCARFLTDERFRSAEMPFAKVIRGDLEVLGRLVELLDYHKSPESLLPLIHPEIVKHSPINHKDVV